MKAVVMAGGAGTRLRPLTTSTPKPLLPVAGRPLLEHALRHLRHHGITDAVITLQYLGAKIRTYFGDGADIGMTLSYATEPRPVGTAGSVKYASAKLRDDPFLVISGDGLTDVDLAALIDFHRHQGAAVTVCLTRRENPVDFGLVVTEPDGRIIRFQEKPSWSEVFTDTVNTGIYVVEPSVLDHIPDETMVDWSKDVFPRLLEAGAPLFGYVSAGYWEDVGTLDAYRRVQADALDGKIRLDIPGFQTAQGVWLGAGAEVSPGVVVKGPAVLGDFTRVERGASILPYTVLGRHTVLSEGATVERSVLLDNVFVGRGAELRGCVVGQGSDIRARARVEEGASIGDDCRLETESIISAGVDVYPYKTIEAGEVVTEDVVWDSRSPRQMLAAERFSGVVNIDITAESAARLAGAFATILPKGAAVMVARDHSQSSHAFSLCLMGALTAAGAEAMVLGPVPVPVSRSFVRRHCAGGIYVRTSPGRPDSLDVLLLDGAGVEIGVRARQDLERIINRQDTRRPQASGVGQTNSPQGVVEDYVASVVAATDMRGIAEAKLRIVVDTAGGTCANVLPSLMGAAEVEVLNVNARVTPHSATETAEMRDQALRQLSAMVASSRSSLGARTDPTGERLSIVDETGRVLSDDRALLVVLDLIAAERRGGAVALPVTTTRVAQRVTSFHGVHVLWTATGAQALAAASTSEGLILAGDADGGFVIPAVGRAPDAMAALLAILGLVARTRLTLREIDTRIPSTALQRRLVATPWARKGAVMRMVRRYAGERSVDETEGLRVILDEVSWVLVAPDPSEAAVRLWAEAPTEAQVADILDEWEVLVADTAADRLGADGET